MNPHFFKVLEKPQLKKFLTLAVLFGLVSGCSKSNSGLSMPSGGDQPPSPSGVGNNLVMTTATTSFDIFEDVQKTVLPKAVTFAANSGKLSHFYVTLGNNMDPNQWTIDTTTVNSCPTDPSQAISLDTIGCQVTLIYQPSDSTEGTINLTPHYVNNINAESNSPIKTDIPYKAASLAGVYTTGTMSNAGSWVSSIFQGSFGASIQKMDDGSGNMRGTLFTNQGPAQVTTDVDLGFLTLATVPEASLPQIFAKTASGSNEFLRYTYQRDTADWKPLSLTDVYSHQNTTGDTLSGAISSKGQTFGCTAGIGQKNGPSVLSFDETSQSFDLNKKVEDLMMTKVFGCSTDSGNSDIVIYGRMVGDPGIDILCRIPNPINYGIMPKCYQLDPETVLPGAFTSPSDLISYNNLTVIKTFDAPSSTYTYAVQYLDPIHGDLRASRYGKFTLSGVVKASSPVLGTTQTSGSSQPSVYLFVLSTKNSVKGPYTLTAVNTDNCDNNNDCSINNSSWSNTINEKSVSAPVITGNDTVSVVGASGNVYVYKMKDGSSPFLSKKSFYKLPSSGDNERVYTMGVSSDSKNKMLYIPTNKSMVRTMNFNWK